MPFTRLHSIALIGLDATLVDVEIDVKPAENPSLLLVGLPDTAVRESKDRVLSALKNSGFSFEGLHATINLAPGDVKKEGPIYDLPIALALLSAQKKQTSLPPEDFLCAGELSLDGTLRPMRRALCAWRFSLNNWANAGLSPPQQKMLPSCPCRGISCFTVYTLSKQAWDVFHANSPAPHHHQQYGMALTTSRPEVGCRYSQEPSPVQEAVTIAAGGHNFINVRPSWFRKTILARPQRILPAMSPNLFD